MQIDHYNRHSLSDIVVSAIQKWMKKIKIQKGEENES